MAKPTAVDRAQQQHLRRIRDCLWTAGDITMARVRRAIEIIDEVWVDDGKDSASFSCDYCRKPGFLKEDLIRAHLKESTLLPCAWRWKRESIMLCPGCRKYLRGQWKRAC